MPKINQEEYEVLKGLDDKWKWVARDEDRGLYAFTKKPVRKDGPSSYWWDADGWDAEPYAALGLVDEIHLFQFIQWEDGEPHNIAELIEEYESEEKEVRDLEWAKKEIKELMTEESQSYPHDKMVEQEIVLGILNQLEQETLSQEWIDEHKEIMTEFSNSGFVEEYWVNEDDLQNLLVPKQETIDMKIEEGKVKLFVGFDGGTDIINAQNIEEALDILTDYDASFIISKTPVIPQFVADWIEECKGWNDYEQEYDEDNAIGLSSAMDLDNAGMDDEVHDYLVGNTETFAMAWLHGYTIEEDPKYRIKAGENYLYFNLDGTVRGSTKKNAVITKERLEELPFDVEMAVESGIIEVEELEE